MMRGRLGFWVGAVAAALGSLTSFDAHATGEAINGFPNWQERVMHEWTNRARCDPQVEMQLCGSACSEGACYTPQAPLPWMQELNHAARFHSDEMNQQNYFAHNSICTVVSNINTLYPGSCTGAASCACVGGTDTCSPTCTAWNQRVALFGASAAGEIIASSTDPNSAFYQWLYEPYNSTTCGYNQGPPTNGHRYNILMSGPAVGYGAGPGPSVGDFGGSGTKTKIISGSHYPRSGASVDAWANWVDTAAPSGSMINVDGNCTAMTLTRGTGTNGAYHAALSNLSTSCHRYFFLFHDSANNLVTYPDTGSLGIGPANSCADWDTSRPTTGTSCLCTPQCSGKQCGPDGCGGSCGNCNAPATCVNSQCVSPTPDGGAPDGGTTDGGSKSDGGTTGNDGGNNVNDGGGPGGDGGTGGGGGGCSCDVTGHGGDLTALVALGGLAVVIARRRRRCYLVR